MGSHTLSRISTRVPASAGLRGGEPLGDCSARRVVDTMKGISCDATPSFVRSSGVIGGKSHRARSSVVASGTLRDWGSLWGTWLPVDMSNPSQGTGVGSELQIIGCSSTFLGVYRMSHAPATSQWRGMWPISGWSDELMDSHTSLVGSAPSRPLVNILHFNVQSSKPRDAPPLSVSARI